MANNKIKIDDLISTISDFKSTAKGQMINIHQKEYATVAHRLAVARRNLGLKLSIQTELVSADENTVTMKASVFIILFCIGIYFLVKATLKPSLTETRSNTGNLNCAPPNSADTKYL